MHTPCRCFFFPRSAISIAACRGPGVFRDGEIKLEKVVGVHIGRKLYDDGFIDRLLILYSLTSIQVGNLGDSAAGAFPGTVSCALDGVAIHERHGYEQAKIIFGNIRRLVKGAGGLMPDAAMLTLRVVTI